MSLKKNAVSQRVNKMGKFILLCKGDFNWQECLSLYRSKDVVEKGFYVLKNNPDVTPAYVKKDSMFMCFLSLILRSCRANEKAERDIKGAWSVCLTEWKGRLRIARTKVFHVCCRYK
ncbi:MAG: hypothetical protein EF812_03475 [Methanosarcinales archaeon]|nr:MAG: hypothetical protein EF812_03475 [Methanosarcinales archaeon]